MTDEKKNGWGIGDALDRQIFGQKEPVTTGLFGGMDKARNDVNGWTTTKPHQPNGGFDTIGAVIGKNLFGDGKKDDDSGGWF